ncbi:MAG: nucleotide sugar dehydrogenase [Bacteroides stercoris]
MKEKLLSRIAERKITVGVVGLGYVGLPLAVEKAKAGFRTIGFDVQEEKVKLVNAGHNYIGDVVDAELAQLVRNGTLSATSDFSFIKDVDFVAICVPTPLDVHQEPDISYVESSAKSIAGHLTAGTIVVLESQPIPALPKSLIKPILESGSGLKCGKDFYLGFSPERVDPGNAVYKTKNTPKVVGAVGKDAQDVIAAMYESRYWAIRCTSFLRPAVAEMTKILENTYRNINIGLINGAGHPVQPHGHRPLGSDRGSQDQAFRLHRILSRTGAGRALHSPGPYYLTWKAREYGFHTSMIEASMMINDHMPEYTVERCGKILNRHRKALNGSRVLVLGVAYKQDIDDYRESALRVIEELEKTGASVTFYDPYLRVPVSRQIA